MAGVRYLSCINNPQETTISLKIAQTTTKKGKTQKLSKRVPEESVEAI